MHGTSVPRLASETKYAPSLAGATSVPWFSANLHCCAQALCFLHPVGFQVGFLVEEKPKPGFVLRGSQFRSPEKRSSSLRTIVTPCCQELCISHEVVFLFVVHTSAGEEPTCFHLVQDVDRASGIGI